METKHPISREQSHRENYEETAHLAKSEKAYESAKKVGILSKAIAYIGILIGVFSLFFYPYVLGIIGIIFGFISMKMGEIVLSSWAIGICAVSIILSVFVVPIL